jgi:hypothetical protein
MWECNKMQRFATLTPPTPGGSVVEAHLRPWKFGILFETWGIDWADRSYRLRKTEFLANVVWIGYPLQLADGTDVLASSDLAAAKLNRVQFLGFVAERPRRSLSLDSDKFARSAAKWANLNACF